ncbi:MAG: hypothetical protein SFU56_02010 [Capsulimonadales bacterium]|nr:hypothetical protein [Capsulimonadales bacterium]
MTRKNLVRVTMAVTALLVMSQGVQATPPELKPEPKSIIAILIGLFQGR